jgi:hypothetical protein
MGSDERYAAHAHRLMNERVWAQAVASAGPLVHLASRKLGQIEQVDQSVTTFRNDEAPAKINSHQCFFRDGRI